MNERKPPHLALFLALRNGGARRRIGAALAAVLFVPALVLAQSPDDRDEESDGCPEGRISDYLRRHGDLGVIDPESLLDRTRAVHEELQQRHRLGSEAVNGSVWTSLGPTNGAGRATAVAPHPTIAGTALVGAAGGGVWRTADFGQSWTPLTETVANLSVGALAYAPSDPNVVYLGTGEGGYAIDFVPGIGLLQSSDGGANWNLPSSVIATEFYRLLVDPSDPNIVIAGTNNGALRSTGGQNGPWTAVIASGSSPGNTGFGDVTDMVRDPGNPKVLYATTWDRNAWCQNFRCSNPFVLSTPLVLKSTDGGVTWNPASTGLPASSKTQRVNRMSIAIAPSAPQTLYVATSIFDSATSLERSHIYRSNDGGASWTETGLNANHTLNNYLRNQAWYDNAIVVSPTNPELVIAAGVTTVKSTDGGTTWFQPTGSLHVDFHDLRYDANNRLWLANDGGIWTSTNDAMTVVDRNAGLATRQFYAISNDPANRSRVFGGQQDNGTSRRPDTGGTSWSSFTGSDGFVCLVHPLAPEIVFTTAQNEVVYRSPMGGGAPQAIATTNLSPPFDPGEAAPFLSIVALDPQSPSTVYATSYRIWKSSTGGDSWVPLSTTTTDGSVWVKTSVVDAFAIAPSDSQVMMVATRSRTVFRTTNGGTSWVQAIAGLPNRYVNHLEIHPTEPRIAYAAIAGTSGPSVYWTTDGGLTWNERGNGLPPFSALVVRFDPTDPNTVYCGTDVGVYRSTDAGANWSRFGTGMPAVSVYDVQILRDGSILRAGTHGRGTWELQIAPGANHAPSVAITSPATAQTVTKGSTLIFTGTFSDADHETPTGRWTFPDTWSSVATASGSGVPHRFDRAGFFPVTLSATDSAGALATASVNVTVTEAGDSCANPIVIPGDGPFPYAVTLNVQGATAEGTDPIGTCYPFLNQTSIWLSFTPAQSGTYRFSFCGSRATSFLKGFTGDACGTYTPVQDLCLIATATTNDCSNDSLTIAPALTAGTTYRLMAGNYFYYDFGPITLSVTKTTSPLNPAITSIDPSVGPSAGNAQVTITGSGFTTSTTVTVDGMPATNVQMITPSVITATLPAHAPGTVDVSVSGGGITSTLGKAFTYAMTIQPAPPRRRIAR